MNHDLTLNIPDMDTKHEEFLEILDLLKEANKSEFFPLFEKMMTHTKEHFQFEEALMTQHNFYGLNEHKDEHELLLGEMHYFYEKGLKLPSFAKSYITEYAYDKFKRHIINIDSQLAMFLKEQALEQN